MKKLFILLLLTITTVSYGQIKISQLTGATTINSSDLFPLSQGASSRKLTYDLLKYKIFNTIPYALRLNYLSDSLRIGFDTDSTKFETNNHYFIFNKKLKASLFLINNTDTCATKAYARSLIIDNTWPEDSANYASKSYVLQQITDTATGIRSWVNNKLYLTEEVDPIWISDSANYISKSQARNDINDSIENVKSLLRGENTWHDDSLNYASKSYANNVWSKDSANYASKSYANYVWSKDSANYASKSALALKINYSDTITKVATKKELASKQDTIDNNIIYVPINGNIQTYINNAIAGSTLILASGVYTVTSSITISKQLNIKGQGSSGFVTTPVTPSHGTLISSSTSGIVAFQLNNDNIRISDLSIHLTGNAPTAVNTANNLQGLVFSNMDVIETCSGIAHGFTVYGSDVVMRNLTFYITSTNTAASGVWLWNDASTTRNAIVDAFNVTGTVQGAGSYAYAFVCENVNDANTLTMNLNYSICKALPGTPLDVAVASISTTTNNSIVNTNMGQFEGADYDAYQTGSNQLNLGGSVIFNDKIFGTVTYRAAMIANQVRADTVKITGNIFAKNHYNGQIITRDSTLATLKYVDDRGMDNINANKGLTRDVDTIKLGGNFSSNIDIYSNEGKSFYLRTFDNEDYEGSVYGDTTRLLLYKGKDNDESYVEIGNNQLKFAAQANTDKSEVTLGATGGFKYVNDYSANYTSQSLTDSAFVKKAIMSLAPVYNSTHLYMDSVVLDSVEIRTNLYKKIVNSTDSTLQIIPQFLIAKYRPIASYNPEENCTLFFYLTNNITRNDYETAAFGLTPLFYNKNQNYSFPYIMPTSLSTSGIPNSNSLYIRTGASAIGGGKATMTIVLYYFKIKKG